MNMAKGTFYHIISRVVFVLSGYAIHIGIARYLGAEQYGLFGVVFSLLSINDLLLRRGMYEAVSKHTAEAKKLSATILNIGLRLQLIFAVSISSIYFLSAGFIARFLGDATLTGYIRLSVLCIIPYALYAVYFGHLNGIREFGKQSGVVILYSLSKALAIWIFILFGYQIKGAIYGYIIAACIAMLIARHFRRKSISDEVNSYFSAKKLIIFAMPVILFSVAITILMNTDILLIKRLLGDNAQTGFYASALNLSRMPWYISVAFAFTLLPSISHSTSTNNNDLTKRYIGQSLRYLLMLIIPGAFLISGSADSLIQLLYSAGFISASLPLGILIFGMSFLVVFGSFATIITGSGKPTLSALFAAMMIPISVVLNLILIPRYQLIGAAVASSLAYVIGMSAAGIYVYIQFGTCINIVSTLKILAASIVVYLLVTRFPITGIALLGEYAVLFIVYIALLFLFKEIKSEDILVARKILNLA